jgi:FHS family L-fucose permease-like MFS transporter
MIIPVVWFLPSWGYAIACNFVPAFRDVIDRVGDSSLGIDPNAGALAREDVEEKKSLEKV